MNRFRASTPVRLALAVIKSFKWTRYYLRYSGALRKEYDSTVTRAKIMKESHTIEKGLSFANVRPHFGAEKRATLIASMKKSASAGDNAMPRSIGASVLKKYVEWHAERGHRHHDLITLERMLQPIEVDRELGGTVLLRPDYRPDETAQFDRMFMARRSVRNFKPDPVPQDTILEALRIANYSPSVCNRQSWAAVAIQDPVQVRKALSLQNGNRGFEDTIGNVIIILADVRGFLDEYEIYEPFVDAGIFSGAVVNALNARNIGSCCLNLCVSHHKAIEVLEAFDIPAGFYPIMMIACGYAAENCQVAKSTRLEPEVFFI